MTTSAYKIFWVEFTAEQGKVVIKDIEAINGRKGYNGSAFGNGKSIWEVPFTAKQNNEIYHI